jgi:oligopeptide/dipeptide ABC transporter ATP-binding protein
VRGTKLPAGYIEQNLIDLEEVKVVFRKKSLLKEEIVIKAVDGVNLKIGRGEIVGLVGESGSGKTTLGLAAIGLVKATSGKVVLYKAEDKQIEVSTAKGAQWKRLRSDLQIVFQDPFSSIDPNMKVYDVLRIPLQTRGIKDKSQLEARIASVFEQVGLPADLLGSYIFQLSGGQRQRVGIARVLLFEPSFIVADEPVSMLDVSLKGDILTIIKKIAENFQVAFLFITHEMAVAKVISDRIAVMYLGQIVELGTADTVISNPLHPYTKALLEATPNIDPSKKGTLKEINIRGDIAAGGLDPQGCKFHARCPFAMDICLSQVPSLKENASGHSVACWLY